VAEAPEVHGIGARTAASEGNAVELVMGRCREVADALARLALLSHRPAARHFPLSGVHSLVARSQRR